MSIDPFASPKAMFRHALRHSDEFDRIEKAFMKTKPYAFVIETDPDTGDDLHKFKLVKPVPEKLALVAFDAMNNARSALDQAVYAILGKGHVFPCGGNDLDEFTNSVRKRLQWWKRIDVLDFLCSFKAYKGGNTCLWIV